MSIIVSLFMITGVIFIAIAVLGIIRMPDFYTRLHAASKCDTLGLMLILLAVILHTLQDLTLINFLTSLKLAAILIFIFVASPTTAHALTESALINGIKPWSRKDRKS